MWAWLPLLPIAAALDQLRQCIGERYPAAAVQWLVHAVAAYDYVERPVRRGTRRGGLAAPSKLNGLYPRPSPRPSLTFAGTAARGPGFLLLPRGVEQHGVVVGDVPLQEPHERLLLRCRRCVEFK